MARRSARDPIYSGCRFSAETIETCVRWYITYRLSYRDLAAMMAEQGIVVSHTTIMRWVLRYVPEYERRWARFARSPGSSWRMDETAVSVRGGRHYLYRAVDQHGKSVASLLCGDRSMEAARAFFRAAVSQGGVPWPEKINVDGNSATHRGLRLLDDEDRRWQGVEVRARRYLNNVVEQDHRAIKQRCASMLGLKGFHSAAITLAGIELAHRIRKRQYTLPTGTKGWSGSLKASWEVALADSGAPVRRCAGTSAGLRQCTRTQRNVPSRRASECASRDRCDIRGRSSSAEACICWSGRRVGVTGTTSTDTAASERRSRSGPHLMYRLHWFRHATAPHGGCSLPASIRRCGDAKCGR